jgi:hypothetical protein
MYNTASLFYCQEDNNAKDQFSGNFIMNIYSRGLDSITTEREIGESIFKIELIKPLNGREKDHLATYDVNMDDLEIFAKSILAHIESTKYYHSGVIQDKINRGDVI